MLVLFFNGVKGVVSAEHIPKSSIFFVGQTVTCHILSCFPAQKRIRISLMNENIKVNNKEENEVRRKRILSIDAAAQPFEPHVLQNAVIKIFNKDRIKVKIQGVMKGRIHITQIAHETEEGVCPCDNYTIKQHVPVHVLSAYSVEDHSYRPITFPNEKYLAECSLTYPPPVPLDLVFKEGMRVNGFIKQIENEQVVVCISPLHCGIMPFLNYSQNVQELRTLKEKLKMSVAIKATILSVNGEVRARDEGCQVTLTRLDSNPVAEGRNCIGLVTIVSKEGLTLKLPHGYEGTVSWTHLDDKFQPPGPVMAKYKALKYVQCHVLQIDLDTKKCVLSLRETRTCPESGSTSGHIDPEITANSIPVNERIKSFITSCTTGRVTVTFGLDLHGKMALHHRCGFAHCSECHQSRDYLKKHRPGDVVEVVVTGRVAINNLYPVQICELVEGYKPSIINQNSLCATGDEVFGPHILQPAVITNVDTDQISLIVKGIMKGRIHCTQFASGLKEGASPFDNYSVKQCLSVHVFSQFCEEEQCYLPIGQQLNEKNLGECSFAYPPPVPLDAVFQEGMTINGFIRQIEPKQIVVWLSPLHCGILHFLHYSEDESELRELHKILKVGQAIRSTILSVKGEVRAADEGCKVSLTRLDSNPVAEGRNCIGLVTGVSNEGLTLKLPYGFEGTVSLPHLDDNFQPPGPVMAKYKALKYVQCHVLEIDQDTKKCVLSLRESRLRNGPVGPSDASDPEITADSVPLNQPLKSFVTRITNGEITVSFGRNLVGQMALHACHVCGCLLCQKTEEVLQKYSTGDVVEVEVTGLERDGASYPIQLCELKNISAGLERLSVPEDIDWDEV